MPASGPMNDESAIVGETCHCGGRGCALNPRAKNAPTVTTGTVNRLGNHAPAAKPTADSAGIPAAPTMAGHQSGPPQCACRAVSAYRTPTQQQYATSAQQVTAAQVASCVTHRGLATVAIRSVSCRLPSREPIQAAAPTTGGAKSSRT